jgi:hypothetical protein
MAPYSFTARQVVDLTGMSRPVLSDLLRRGVVEPSKHRGTGTGDNHLFDLLDLFGIAAVQHLRPKAETTALMRAVFDFWHSKVGRRLVDGPKSVSGVVVVDIKGKVALEQETDVVKLAAARESATLYVVEPNRLREELYGELGLRRMQGDHVEPLPSGREPRRKDLVQPGVKVVRPERGAEKERSASRSTEKNSRGKT